ncbi:MAG: nuclease-related domain-containing protein [Alkalibacterium sp.]
MITFNGSTAQLDALILNGNNFYLYEVKNYEGEYEQHDGQFKRLN